MSHTFFPDCGSPNRPSQFAAGGDAAEATRQGGLTEQTRRAACLWFPRFCEKCCALVPERLRSPEAKGQYWRGTH